MCYLKKKTIRQTEKAEYWLDGGGKRKTTKCINQFLSELEGPYNFSNRQFPY